MGTDEYLLRAGFGGPAAGAGWRCRSKAIAGRMGKDSGTQRERKNRGKQHKNMVGKS